MRRFTIRHFAALCGVSTSQVEKYISHWLNTEVDHRGEVWIIYDIVAAMLRRRLCENPTLPPLCRRLPGRVIRRYGRISIRLDNSDGRELYHVIQPGCPVRTFSSLARAVEYCNAGTFLRVPARHSCSVHAIATGSDTVPDTRSDVVCSEPSSEGDHRQFMHDPTVTLRLPLSSCVYVLRLIPRTVQNEHLCANLARAIEREKARIKRRE